MTKVELFTISKCLDAIEMRIENAFNYIRPDSRGELMRERKRLLIEEIKELRKFLELKPDEK